MPNRRDPKHQELRLHGQRLLTVAEAATRLEIPEKKVRQLIREGVLSTVTKLGPRSTRIPEHDVAVLVCRRGSGGTQ